MPDPSIPAVDPPITRTNTTEAFLEAHTPLWVYEDARDVFVSPPIGSWKHSTTCLGQWHRRDGGVFEPPATPRGGGRRSVWRGCGRGS